MSEDSIAFDSVLDLCQNQHRRIVLGTLAEEQRSLTVNDLTKAILKYNHQMPITEASEDVLTEIRLSLYHVHLPKLASKGLINYDTEKELVEPIEQFDQVQPTLSTILDADPSLKAPMKL
jgi:DNA-binding transcriptional ArsR family regulator